MADDTIPRGKIIGTPVDPRTGKPVEFSEQEHYMKCPACGGWIDCRDLGMVFEHLGAHELPAGDGAQ